MVKFVLGEKKELIRKELLAAKTFSFCFDSTYETAEMFSLVVRIVSASSNITHRLVRVEFLRKSLSGDDMAKLLLQSIDIANNIVNIRWGTRWSVK